MVEKYSLDHLVLPRIEHYEEVVGRVEQALRSRGYDRGLAINYAPAIVNSFFDFDTERFMDQRNDIELDVNRETKRLKETVAELHRQGVYVTLEDYIEFRHDYDKLRKLFSKTE
ncbi:hypothetical protein KY343_00455 [Candidatus Woesearchaeota archaeon]|nr:hypothetical protein [Candidatus Woesearchaeota archaeon]